MSWNELHWGIPWALMVRGLADAPSYTSNSSPTPGKKSKQTSEKLSHDEFTEKLMKRVELMNAQKIKKEIDNIPR